MISHLAQDGGAEQRYSLYGLLTQLALDGKPDVEVSYHNLSRPGGDLFQPTSALQRFGVTTNRYKGWVCAKARTEGGNLAWHQVARCVKADALPNRYLTIAWETKLLSGRVLSFERPFLVWTSTMTFAKDQFFRFA